MFFATEAQSSQSPSLVDWLGFRAPKIRGIRVILLRSASFAGHGPRLKTSGVRTTRLGLCELCASVAKTCRDRADQFTCSDWSRGFFFPSLSRPGGGIGRHAGLRSLCLNSMRVRVSPRAPPQEFWPAKTTYFARWGATQGTAKDTKVDHPAFLTADLKDSDLKPAGRKKAQEAQEIPRRFLTTDSTDQDFDLRTNNPKAWVRNHHPWCPCNPWLKICRHGAI